MSWRDQPKEKGYESALSLHFLSARVGHSLILEALVAWIGWWLKVVGVKL